MNVRRVMVAATLALAVFTLPRTAESSRQSAAAPGQPARPAGVQAPQGISHSPAGQRIVTTAPPESAELTRRSLRKVLTLYSPNVGRVLALDPLLLQNPSYLEPYPELVAFLNQHPEVTRNAAYYLADFRPDYYVPPTAETQAIRMWENFFAGLAIFSVFLVVTGTVIWVIKTLVDYRRWYRLSKVQTEAHNKLLDRFTANEELLAYINTPSGKRFLESAPIMVDGAASISSPLKRILWAVEIGVVLVCGAGGILIARYAVPPDFGQPFTVAGWLIVALGVGFVLAAAASYLISKRLGVLVPVSSGTGRTDAPAA